MTWVVGNVRITRVVEFVMPFPVDFFAEATPEDFAAEAWLVPDHFVDADGMYLMSLRTFVVEPDGTSHSRRHVHGQRKVSIADPGVRSPAPAVPREPHCSRLRPRHDRHRRLHSPARRSRGMGTTSGQRRIILLRSLARYLFGAADIDCCAHSEDGLHAPGHMSVWIGDRCLITGDVLHHRIECGHPDWTARGARRRSCPRSSALQAQAIHLTRVRSQACASHKPGGTRPCRRARSPPHRPAASLPQSHRSSA